MSLQTRLDALITAIGTDYKGLRTWITGSATGDLSGLTTTAKTSLVAAINEVDANVPPAPPSATESVSGTAEIATQTEVNTGTDDSRIVTPLKFQTRMAAYAQPLNANLTEVGAVDPGTMGKTILGRDTATQVRSDLGLATVATTGSASDITTGTLPTNVLPALAINDVFTAASQAAMLALSAQRGDVAIRTDQGRTYILATDSPGTLADWKQLTAAGDVLSVAGKTGVVTLAKGDVGLSNVDNTSDAAKPVSTAQQTALNAKMDKSANLSDVASVATARTNLSVYSQAELGNPETDLVAAYTTAKA